jgi:hypothetical protein
MHADTERSPPARRALIIRSATNRSRVTNGKTHFVEADGRGPWARRWSDVLAEIISDIGGHDGLSEGQRQLARRCATIAIACERMEGEAAKGNAIDLETYGTLTDRLGRCFQRIGLKRSQRDVTPTSLSDYLRSRYPDEAAEEGEATAQAGAGASDDAGHPDTPDGEERTTGREEPGEGAP